MKVVVVIFLFLCFHLVGGSGSAYAGLRGGNPGFVSKSAHSNASTSVLTGLGGAQFIAENSGAEDENQLMGIEDDDEDETKVFTKKNFRPDRHFSTFLYALLVKQHGNGSSIQHPLFKTLAHTSSCLYLEQKALLI